MGTIENKMENILTRAKLDRASAALLHAVQVSEELMRRPAGATHEELEILLNRLRDSAVNAREFIKAEG